MQFRNKNYNFEPIKQFYYELNCSSTFSTKLKAKTLTSRST